MTPYKERNGNIIKICCNLPNKTEVWLLENIGFHELEEFVPVLIGGNPNFCPKMLFSLFVTSGNTFFPAKEVAAGGKVSPFVAFALIQLTTSLNFSWNNTCVDFFNSIYRWLESLFNVNKLLHDSWSIDLPQVAQSMSHKQITSTLV